tara:strand:- start:336327 stop:336533 length:207 start_codon:yes stop_codon:yes gene_type:complete
VTSSSPRAAPEFEAVLVVDRNVTGPVMLPEKDPEAFVDQFNTIYRSVGMSIQPTCHPAGPDDDGHTQS